MSTLITRVSYSDCIGPARLRLNLPEVAPELKRVWHPWPCVLCRWYKWEQLWRWIFWIVYRSILFILKKLLWYSENVTRIKDLNFWNVFWNCFRQLSIASLILPQNWYVRHFRMDSELQDYRNKERTESTRSWAFQNSLQKAAQENLSLRSSLNTGTWQIVNLTFFEDKYVHGCFLYERMFGGCHWLNR